MKQHNSKQFAVQFPNQESFNLYRTVIDRALNGKDLRPKDRSLMLDQYAAVTGHEHPTRESFVVYGYYDESQAAEHGTRIWADADGKEWEVSHVSYRQEGPDRYPGASFAGRFVRFIRNERPSMQFLQREATRQHDRANKRNLNPVAAVLT